MGLFLPSPQALRVLGIHPCFAPGEGEGRKEEKGPFPPAVTGTTQLVVPWVGFSAGCCVQRMQRDDANGGNGR